MFYKWIIKPNRKRMTRSRGANRNARNSEKNITRSLIDRTVCLIKSVSHLVLNNVGGIAAGVMTPLHPNYGVGGINGGQDTTWNLASIVYGSNAGSGLFINFSLLKAKLTFRLRNGDAIGILFTILPVSNSNVGAIAANYLKNLSNIPSAKRVYLSKAGVTGDTKTFKMTIDVPKLEGYSKSQYESNPQYYATSASIGGYYSAYYIQALTDNLSTVLANGTNVEVEAEYMVRCIQSNLKLEL